MRLLAISLPGVSGHCDDYGRKADRCSQSGLGDVIVGEMRCGEARRRGQGVNGIVSATQSAYYSLNTNSGRFRERRMESTKASQPEVSRLLELTPLSGGRRG